MKHRRRDIANPAFILFIILFPIEGSSQNNLKYQDDVAHLPQTKFNFNEYFEYPDTENKDRGPASPQWSQAPYVNRNMQMESNNQFNVVKSTQYPDTFDPNISWDSEWAMEIKFVQISAVSIDPNGNIAVFHRGDRIWDASTFDTDNKFDPLKGPVVQDTIILLDKSGKKIIQWGKNMFYLPHGLTVDSLGNYWITDVAMHQVFKFNADDINRHWNELRIRRAVNDHDNQDLFRNSTLKPALILGEAFEPGNDDKHFCQPTAVAVQKNGDFFVSDGYCNSRIIKFNKNGERISQWGRHWGTGETVFLKPPPPYAFFVPHALALAEELNYLFVADRENGRVTCFFMNNGTYHREYKHPIIGSKIYSIAYLRDKLYLVNGPSYPIIGSVHTRGFIFDIHSNNVTSQFGPGKDLLRPHDIAVSEDGREIYVVDLDTHRIYRFLHDVEKIGSSTQRTFNYREHAPLSDNDSKDSIAEGPTTITLVLSFVTAAIVFIALCIAVAAIIARYQKRGCLLTMRKRMRWEAERRENFKLSNLLENRRGKGFKFFENRPNTKDFRKLNTEPETSEDENPENTLTKII